MSPLYPVPGPVLRPRACPGFTLVELMVAITIVGLVMAASVPASVRFYQSIQYREAIRDVTTALASARFKAVNDGTTQDVVINPETNVLTLNDRRQQLPANFKIAVHAARELNRNAEGVVRFYPEGGSSGGDIDIALPGGSGVKISVDWLVGRVTQQKYDFSQ
jgi:general secretion pathway protein H